jgi:hypothetical protein
MTKEKHSWPRVDVRAYRGRWVALHPKTHEVISDGNSLSEARQSAIRQGIERPVLMMVPRSDGFFFGLSKTMGVLEN